MPRKNKNGGSKICCPKSCVKCDFSQLNFTKNSINSLSLTENQVKNKNFNKVEKTIIENPEFLDVILSKYPELKQKFQNKSSSITPPPPMPMKPRSNNSRGSLLASIQQGEFSLKPTTTKPKNSSGNLFANIRKGMKLKSISQNTEEEPKTTNSRSSLLNNLRKPRILRKVVRNEKKPERELTNFEKTMLRRRQAINENKSINNMLSKVQMNSNKKNNQQRNNSEWN